MPDLDFAERPRTRLFTSIIVLGELFLCPLALLIAWLWPGAPLPPARADLRAMATGALAAAPPLLLLLALLSPAGRKLPFTRKIRRTFREMAGATFAALTGWQMAAMAIAAGLGEELLFRAVLQERMGLTLASVLFGLLHPFSLGYVVLGALFGLYLGWLQAETGNLLVPILAHALYDLVALRAVRREMRRPAVEPALPC